MEFSFAKKHLLPSVPVFMTGSCFLGGAITTLLCWNFTDTAPIWNSVVLRSIIFWDVQGQMCTSCGYKFGFKILKLVY